MSTKEFTQYTATLAEWNLATFESLSEERIKMLAQDQHLLDGEFTTLTQLKNENHLNPMLNYLAKCDVEYSYTSGRTGRPR